MDHEMILLSEVNQTVKVKINVRDDMRNPKYKKERKRW